MIVNSKGTIRQTPSTKQAKRDDGEAHLGVILVDRPEALVERLVALVEGSSQHEPVQVPERRNEDAAARGRR